MKVKVLVAQSCPTLCDPKDCSLPGSSVQGTLQRRMLEGVAMAFSRGSSGPRHQTQVSCIAGRLLSEPQGIPYLWYLSVQFQDTVFCLSLFFVWLVGSKGLSFQIEK